jgi:hypothetical protein
METKIVYSPRISKRLKGLNLPPTKSFWITQWKIMSPEHTALRLAHSDELRHEMNLSSWKSTSEFTSEKSRTQNWSSSPEIPSGSPPSSPSLSQPRFTFIEEDPTAPKNSKKRRIFEPIQSVTKPLAKAKPIISHAPSLRARSMPKCTSMPIQTNFLAPTDQRWNESCVYYENTQPFQTQIFPLPLEVRTDAMPPIYPICTDFEAAENPLKRKWDDVTSNNKPSSLSEKESVLLMQSLLQKIS